MLSREDDELLCRIGPGAPMGTLVRESCEPAAADCLAATAELRRAWDHHPEPSRQAPGSHPAA